MRLSTILLAAAIGSAASLSNAQTNLNANSPGPGVVYHPTLNTWVHGGQPTPPVPSRVPPSTPSGSASRSMTVVHSFGFPSGWLYVRDAAWDGGSLWIGENYNSSIYEIDPVTGSVVSSFYGPDSNPWGLAWNGTELYSATTTRQHGPPADTLPDKLYQVTTTGTKLNDWEVPDSPDASPNGAAFDPVTGSLWLSDSYYNKIYETDPATGTVLSSFTFPGAEPLGLTWDGAYLYAIDGAALSILMLDTAGTVIDTVSIAPLGSDPQGLTWDGQYFWVTENSTDTIYQVDLGLAVGIPFCFGDPGLDTPCPCANDNDGSVPGSGCANGVFASGAQLKGHGAASLTGDTLVLATTGLEPNESGLYFQADNDLSPGIVWGDGLQCAGGQLKRLGVRFSDAAGYSDTSGYTLPISVKAGNVTAGDTKYYQCWYRNPTGSPCGTDFNASNGYAITWTP